MQKEDEEENAKWPARKINNKSRLVADRGNLSRIFIILDRTFLFFLGKEFDVFLFQFMSDELG